MENYSEAVWTRVKLHTITLIFFPPNQTKPNQTISFGLVWFGLVWFGYRSQTLGYRNKKSQPVLYILHRGPTIPDHFKNGREWS